MLLCSKLLLGVKSNLNSTEYVLERQSSLELAREAIPVFYMTPLEKAAQQQNFKVKRDRSLGDEFRKLNNVWFYLEEGMEKQFLNK